MFDPYGLESFADAFLKDVDEGLFDIFKKNDNPVSAYNYIDDVAKLGDMKVKFPDGQVKDIGQVAENFIDGSDSGSMGYDGGGADTAALMSDYLNADLAKAYGMDNATAYQEALANTSYQRAVKDLQAAGLNPVLALGKFGGAGGVGYISDNSGGSSGGSAGSRSFDKGSQILDSVGTALAFTLAYGASKNVMAATGAASAAHYFLQGVSKLF